MLSAALTLVALFACKLTPPISVTGAVETTINKGSTRVIKLAELTDFEWEKVFVFGPYTPDSTIEQSLGFPWSDAHKFSLSSSDSFWLIVFTLNKQVVRVEQMSRRSTSFSTNTLNRGFSPSEAVFTISGRTLTIQ
jgi:hypothetical protein